MAVAFQYLSDVHLEMGGGLPDVPRNAPFLILAGDIGDPASEPYRAFLERMSLTFDTVFVLAGNHEYYSHGSAHARGREWIARVDASIRSVTSAFQNVVYLQNEVVDIPGTDVSVFGGTLWTDVPHAQELAIGTMIADYRCIPGFTIPMGRDLHAETIRALEAALKARPDRVFVVATHHMPKKSLIRPRYAGSPLNGAFASDVSFADDERIVAWVSGHTHTAHDEGKFKCNPVGYPGENAVVDMGLSFTVPGAADPAAKRRCV